MNMINETILGLKEYFTTFGQVKDLIQGVLKV